MYQCILALPFAVLSLCSKQKGSFLLRSFIASFSILALFCIPYSIYFFAPIFLLSLANTIHLRTFDRPLPWKSIKMIRHFSSLKSSIDHQISLFYLPVFCVGAIFYTLFLQTPPPIYLALLPLLFFCPKKLLPYPYLLLFSLFSKKKQAKEGAIPSSENEIVYRTNKNFPLEKYCSGFYGKKIFDLPNTEKPHVVFLYLESFRAKEVGKCTPHFDKLKEQGVYFSNFYANASQTFKAMFATLYGLPPCFGPDYTESSSSVLSLPVRGLPNFFKENGYRNIFMKAGSMHFEMQGDFLRNHDFDALFDEKDVKNTIKEAYGTSWGVHDEFLYTFLANTLQNAREPLFVSAASVTNHHPFLLPTTFTAKYGETPFEQTLEYTDYALGKAVEQLSSLGQPMHLYVMGDHGYPEEHEGRPGLSPSLDPPVTHVPFLLLPLHCGKFTPKTVDAPSSQIDLLPTIMDLYHFKGLHSSLGSSLCRKRKNPHALLLNEAITPISGMATKESYRTQEGYFPLYQTLHTLYAKKQISSSKESLKTLSFEKISIPPKDVQRILSSNPSLETLNFKDSPLIFTLDFVFPKGLQEIILDHNMLLQDTDILFLPATITKISILGCTGLTDNALLYLAKLPIEEISLSCESFSEQALTTFFHKVRLKKLHLQESHLFHGAFLSALKGHPLEEITMEKSLPCTDEFIAGIVSPSLKIFMHDDCSLVTNSSLERLKNTSIEVLHLEKGTNISDEGVAHLSSLRLHTFYMSKSDHITEKGAKALNTPFMQNLFCIDCEKLPMTYQDNPGKQLYFLNQRFLEETKLE